MFRFSKNWIIVHANTIQGGAHVNAHLTKNLSPQCDNYVVSVYNYDKIKKKKNFTWKLCLFMTIL
jgi:hypothetical protein